MKVKIGRIFWSRGLVKSRQKKWRDSRSRETDGGEKIAATTVYDNSAKRTDTFSDIYINPRYCALIITRKS